MGRAKSARGKRPRTQRGRASTGQRQGNRPQRRATAPVAGGARDDQAEDCGRSAETTQAPAGVPASGRASHVLAAPADAGQTASPPAPPDPSGVTRLRVAEVDLWSVALTSALVSLGVRVAVAVALCLSWVVVDVMSPGREPGPSPMWGLTLLAVTVIVHAVLGTALATMIAFFYDVAAQHTGGVHMTLRRRQATASPGMAGIRAVVSHERLRSRLPARLGARV